MIKIADKFKNWGKLVFPVIIKKAGSCSLDARIGQYLYIDILSTRHCNKIVQKGVTWILNQNSNSRSTGKIAQLRRLSLG
jgi:hypothetical protein